jgi:uncharacterized membrane protein
MDTLPSTVSVDPAHGMIEAPLFSALMRPHRSLSSRRLVSIIGLVALSGLLLALPFVFMGYWPVAGFYGLDIALLYWAFRQNIRDGKAYEEIKLSSLELFVRKVDGKGREACWFFSPLWTRLEHDRGSDQEIRHLHLISRGVRLSVGEYLSAEDREDFGQCLGTALRDARKGPVFNNSF